jgi:hypothetical protein
MSVNFCFAILILLDLSPTRVSVLTKLIDNSRDLQVSYILANFIPNFTRIALSKSRITTMT